jgi:hypothetical protein
VLFNYNAVHKLQSVDARGASGQPNGFAAQYNRDNDDLVTSIAPLVTGTGVPTMTLTRSPLDGHLAATSMGMVSTAYSHDISTSTPGHGDLLGISDAVSGSEIYGTTYTRDALGRITRIDETIQGASSTKKYEYDGRSVDQGARRQRRADEPIHLRWQRRANERPDADAECPARHELGLWRAAG